MNRRTFLTASVTTLVTPLAGCLSDSNENSEANTSDNGDTTQDVEFIQEGPRVDIPPHEIDTPEVEDNDDFDPNDWNDDYLGEHMKQEPSLSFDVLLQSSSNMTILEDELKEDERSYQTKLVTNENDYEEVFNYDGMDEETQEQLTAVDLDESVLVVVESGWGSSSYQHQWKRVVDVAEGIHHLHLHGYYTRPYEVTSDIAPQLSVIEVERPTDEIEVALVSLTVDEDRRVNFNSTEGVVTPDEESGRRPHINILNDTAESQMTYLTIRTYEETILEETVEVDPDERQSVDSQIGATGEYDISLSVDDGPETSFTWDVGENALSMGTDVDLLIEEDEVRGIIEE